MQQNQRFILFLVLASAMFFAWVAIGPRLFPNMFPRPRPAAQAGKTQKSEKTGKTALKTPAKKTAAQKTAKVAGGKPPRESVPPAEARKPIARKPQKKVPQQKEHVAGKKEKPNPPREQVLPQPRRTVKLGSLDPESGYFLEVELTSQGAAVKSIALNDPRYRTVADRAVPLKVVDSRNHQRLTLETSLPSVEKQIGRSLMTVDWKVEKPEKPPAPGEPRSEVTFSFTVPNVLKVTKRYWLQKIDVADEAQRRHEQDTNPKGYELKFALTIENLSPEEQTVRYRLQGPIGVPLEDLESTRVFRSIVTGFLEDDGSLLADSKTAAKLADADTPEEWKAPVKYVGVDVHYFAALLMPGGDQLKSPYLSVVKTDVTVAQPKEESDVTFTMESKDLALAAKGKKGSKVEHDYTLFAGPKRKALLEGYDATAIIKFGTFGCFIDALTGTVARGMLWLLNTFHSWGIAYGFAIILLTCCVRAALLPLSRKQVASARKMKELQPKIAELKKKYGSDKEKLGKAQMELFAKSGANPLAGCLPIFLQMPIFIGLYQALRNAVELRLAPFPLTWIDNLAAPDHLFHMPFRIWYLGSYFNLLPIITIFLFVAQQKMFMPPPTDEQQAMQHKMMKYMSIFFGFLFYRVPSGLCVYFIASSIWGMTERKLLDTASDSASPSEKDNAEGPGAGGPQRKPDEVEKPKGFFAKLMQMADEAAQMKAQGNGGTQSGKPKQGASSKGGGGRRRKGKKRR